MSPGRLHVKDWTPLLEKNRKKLAVWKGSTISISGRLTLINSSLSSAFIYHMSMYLFPKTVVKELDKQRRMFFWQGSGTKRKYHLVRWEIICQSKKKVGIGIKDIGKMNISLLCKWWWKLETEDGLWQRIVKAKYMRNNTTSSVKHRLDDSPIWANLIKVKHIYLRGTEIKTKNGKKILCYGVTDSWEINLYVFYILSYLSSAQRNTSLSTTSLNVAGKLIFRDGYHLFFSINGYR